MTYYQQQIVKMKEGIAPREYLYQQVIHAKLFIDTHYPARIELKDMAGRAFFSKFHFLRLFRDIYGETPYQYLKMVRIKKAKELLQTGMPVTEVCFSVGFDSVTSFTGFFKKINGSTPSSFQKSRKSVSTAMSPLKIMTV